MNFCPFDNVQIESFPGAKIGHITEILKNSANPGNPKFVIFSIGINERGNSNTDQVLRSLSDLAQVAKDVFPDALLFIPRVYVALCLDRLKPQEASNLHNLNDKLSTVRGLRVLRSVASCGSRCIENDLIHWTPDMANALLEDWLDQLDPFC